MSRLATWGNELYAGKKSYPFVQKWKTWFTVALILLAIAGGITALRGGFNMGIDFRGGSEFTVSGVENTDPVLGEEAVSEVIPETEATATNIAGGTIRVQTTELSDEQTLEVAENLQQGYNVTAEQVTSNFVGPTWGQAVSQQMFVGLIVFLVLVALYLTIYFRTWKMSAAAIVGLLYVVILTVGIYGAIGFEVTPPAIIGFLLILSYSLYDTVVVFDKIRDNTQNLAEDRQRTFDELVNLAVNQTLVRSITTSIVGILPVGSILFIGAGLLGAGTLRDISLSIFVGIIVGTIATLFIQAPLYALFRRNDDDITDRDERILRRRGYETDQETENDAETATSQ
ncbi:MAG: protein translocase subunit SecF [Yaniella sp.]|uniref:protein translocase subunit SecF n=2 Tax=Yaniella sp. TaxID=2773929 RepID=UPI002648D56B|nr:protein translocase subunit SecF [Yaniella sp.]MDN5730293.1 protein translocase subunit SecF [Yaniella sp.]MDN5814229.1 protein translocase subunit SecF [Yaniella sp.]MDN5817131.1 protein translocase subunit SecF [Yaniella sp.]MDN5837575.1 protein translocase subunit SecF [Yaniella sp.]MDN5888722.1 protein translocase subunit SecF [Yaniella sp.]